MAFITPYFFQHFSRPIMSFSAILPRILNFHIRKDICLVWEQQNFIQTKICNVQTYFTHEYEMYSVKSMLNTKCNMSEHMLHTKIWCIVSELMLHTTMCIVRTYVTHEHLMPFVWTLCHIKTCVMSKICFARIYNIHIQCSARTNVTYENI